MVVSLFPMLLSRETTKKRTNVILDDVQSLSMVSYRRPCKFTSPQISRRRATPHPRPPSFVSGMCLFPVLLSLAPPFVERTRPPNTHPPLLSAPSPRLQYGRHSAIHFIMVRSPIGHPADESHAIVSRCPFSMAASLVSSPHGQPVSCSD